MRPRYSRLRDQRDANFGEIVAFLKVHGIEVIETERPLDILIRRNDGVCGFAEIKTMSRNIRIYKAADVPVFVKQIGAKPIMGDAKGFGPVIRDKKGGNMSEWPESLRVREFPNRRV